MADDDVPQTDDRDPAAVLRAAVEHAIALIDTWVLWDGQPIPVGDRVYTPHKSVRRIVDHLIDHLGELEARLVGEATLPEGDWQASAITTGADLAPFQVEDRQEAFARLGRLGQVWAARLGTLDAGQLEAGQLDAGQLDATPGVGWSARQIAFHLAETIYYY